MTANNPSQQTRWSGLQFFHHWRSRAAERKRCTSPAAQGDRHRRPAVCVKAGWNAPYGRFFNCTSRATPRRISCLGICIARRIGCRNVAPAHWADTALAAPRGTSITFGTTPVISVVARSARGLATERWLEGQKARLIECAHHHLIFTIPHVLNDLWSFNLDSSVDDVIPTQTFGMSRLLSKLRGTKMELRRSR